MLQLGPGKKLWSHENIRLSSPVIRISFWSTHESLALNVWWDLIDDDPSHSHHHRYYCMVMMSGRWWSIGTKELQPIDCKSDVHRSVQHRSWLLLDRDSPLNIPPTHILPLVSWTSWDRSMGFISYLPHARELHSSNSRSYQTLIQSRSNSRSDQIYWSVDDLGSEMKFIFPNLNSIGVTHFKLGRMMGEPCAYVGRQRTTVPG